jgi:hypothetical protein
MPILDNSTRWNSTYNSIKRALALRKRIEYYCVEYQKEIAKDQLSDEDWTYLESIATALSPFHAATLRLEGHAKAGYHGSIWESLPIIETLLSHLEKGLEEQQEIAYTKSKKNTTPTSLGVAYQNAWDKLQKYYNKTDEAHAIYGAAILLHPTYRRHYFDTRWITPTQIEWKELLFKNVRTTWEREYQGKDTEQPAQTAQVQIEEDIFDIFLRGDATLSDNDDCFNNFINSPSTVIDRSSLLSWWNEPANPWKKMRQQAFDLLSIPAMSAEIERVFSSAAITLTPRRNRINDDTLEMLELLNNWLKQGITTSETSSSTPPTVLPNEESRKRLKTH